MGINAISYAPINYEAIEFVNSFKDKVFSLYMNGANVNPYYALLERYERTKLTIRN
jgi:hypothetical protein